MLVYLRDGARKQADQFSTRSTCWCISGTEQGKTDQYSTLSTCWCISGMEQGHKLINIAPQQHAGVSQGRSKETSLSIQHPSNMLVCLRDEAKKQADQYSTPATFWCISGTPATCWCISRMEQGHKLINLANITFQYSLGKG